MKLPEVLRKAIISVHLTGILSGALFILTCDLSAQDTIQDSSQNTIQDTIHLRASRDSVLLKKKGRIVYVNPPADTVQSRTDTTSQTTQKKWIPQPQRATILSAVLPGLGQAYNRKYWKIPIIYAAGAGLFYLYYEDHQTYIENHNEAIRLHILKDPNETLYKNRADDYSRRQVKKLFFLGILYVANVVDAMADAYFVTYDISDDLSFRIKPEIIPASLLTTESFSYGITLSLHF
jgi:hypothetical protein